MTAPGPGYLVLFYFCFLSKFVRLLFHHHLLLFLCLHIEHEHNKLYMLCRKTIWSDNSVPGNICRERETNREHGFWQGVEILLVIFYDHKYPDGNIRDTVTSNMGRCVIGFQIDKTKQMALCHTPNLSPLLLMPATQFHEAWRLIEHFGEFPSSVLIDVWITSKTEEYFFEELLSTIMSNNLETT